jgi:HK97 family phage portal protein
MTQGNMFARVLRAAAGLFERKASAAGRVIALQVKGRPVWTPRDYASLAREGYGRNPVVFRCVRMIAEAVAAVPLTLHENANPLAEHPLLALLRRPNPAQSGAELMETLVGYLQVAGNAYVEAVALDGEVRELHVLRPDRMKVIPGPDGWPQAFEYEAGGRSVTFEAQGEASPILHLKLFHPDNDHYGMSPLEAGAVAADVHNAGSVWNKALLDNAAMPSGALVYRGPDLAPNLTAEQFERLKVQLEKDYQGARNAGRPLVLDGGLEWVPMGLTPADMDFIDAKHVSAREIALAFGVPPMLLGIPGDNTYANYREANLAFWRQTVLPLARKLCQAMGNWLAPRFGGGLALCCDLDAVPALAAEREALWGRLTRADFLTINEKRAAVGLEPLPGGDAISPGSAS